MGDGPRDWSPPGYWDDGPRMKTPYRAGAGTALATAPRRRFSASAVLSALFGVTAVVLTLAPLWSDGSSHRLWTTAGLTAVYLGAAHLSKRRRGLVRGRGLASFGIVTGAVGTALLVWGVLWSELPGVPAPPQVALASSGQAAPPRTPAGQGLPDLAPPEAQSAEERTYEPRTGREVPPAPNAQTVDPPYQLQANLVAIAYEICVGLDGYRGRHGTLPDSLTLQDDGRVTSPDAASIAIVPAYARISYVPNAPDGTSYLTVADTESGMAMSCVRSGGEGWITNS